MPHSIERDGLLRYTEEHPETAPGAHPVLLVHGFGSNHEMNWAAPGWPWALRGLNARTIGVDLRGHGGSVKSHDPALYTPEALVDDLVAILDAEGLERVDVIGYSMGARLTWELALRHPSRVRRAVLGGFGPRPLGDVEDATFTASLELAAKLPGNDLAALRACAKGQAEHPFDVASGAPKAPMLLAAGEHDSIAEGIEELAALATGPEVLRLPRRDHLSAISDRTFKKGAVEFLTGDDPDGSTGGAGGAGGTG